MSNQDKSQKYSDEELEEIKGLVPEFHLKHLRKLTRQEVIDNYNAQVGKVNDCPKCKGKRQIIFLDQNEREYTKPCECVKRIEAERNAHESGLTEAVKKSRFEDFIAKESWQSQIKERALAYAENPTKWLYISGQVGSGKTHLVLSIVNELLLKGKQVKFFQWGKHNLELKAKVTLQDEYQALMDVYENADVLVIDDFMKDVTQADIKLMYSLLNTRYNNNRITLFTSEKQIEDITQKIDEAIGSRIEEMAQGNILQIAQGKNRNQRRLIK